MRPKNVPNFSGSPSRTKLSIWRKYKTAPWYIRPYNVATFDALISNVRACRMFVIWGQWKKYIRNRNRIGETTQHNLHWPFDWCCTENCDWTKWGMLKIVCRVAPNQPHRYASVVFAILSWKQYRKNTIKILSTTRTGPQSHTIYYRWCIGYSAGMSLFLWAQFDRNKRCLMSADAMMPYLFVYAE